MEQSECVEQQTSGAASDPTASLPATGATILVRLLFLSAKLPPDSSRPLLNYYSIFVKIEKIVMEYSLPELLKFLKFPCT